MKKTICVFSIILLVVCQSNLFAQFYNGTQMSFGKNRVQYGEAFWRYYRYQEFDVFYDKAGKSLAEYVAKNALTIQNEVYSTLQINYSRRIIFVVFNTIQDFKQSNIGLSTSDDHYNIGGTTQIIDNKVILCFNGDHNDLQKQIARGIALLSIREFLYGTENYREIISNSASQEYPEWFIEGLAEYVSGNWNASIEQQLIQFLQKKERVKLPQLEGENATLIGNALWKYIAQKYGTESISNILFLSKISEDISKSFACETRKELNDILYDFKIYYEQKHKLKNAENQTYTKVRLSRKIKKTKITAIALNPVSTDLLIVTNKEGKSKIFLQKIEKRRKNKISSFGYSLKQIQDYTYPIIAWHPTGKVFSYFYEKKGAVWYVIYDLESKEKFEREFHHFEKVLSFEYSNDGNSIVFSGIKGGQTDIFTYNPQTYNFVQITNDIADDFQPTFVQQDKAILYSSNRQNSDNSSKEYVQTAFDLFIVQNVERNPKIQNIQETKFDNETNPLEITKDTYIYISDRNGINNLYSTSQDSVVQSVDTTIHYRFFNTVKPLTNSKYNFETFSFGVETNTLLLHSIRKNKNYIEVLPIKTLQSPDLIDVDIAYFKKNQDSLQLAKQTLLSKKLKNAFFSNELIDFNSYIFEFERNPYNEQIDSVFFSDSLYKREVIPRVYETNFYINKIVNQIDFGFLNNGYQTFTGDAFYFTPGLNLFLKFGVIDLFEDYRLTGGVRFTGNISTNEYLMSIENLKKRWDKQFIFHKQTLMSYTIEGKSGFSIFYHKLQDYNFKYFLKYPFNQVSGLIISPNVRYNQDIIVSTEINSLREPTKTNVWSGFQVKYIYDNTNEKSLNILEGTRMLVFAEGFAKITNTNENLIVLGLDARNYTTIHKKIIVASRIAYSYSQGKSPLLYYLGSLDNWINLGRRYETFNSSIEYDKTEQWSYQSIATNLRGFNQNIRNGPSFCVVNAEIRIPIIQYIANRPLSSDILHNFQIVTFADAGAAWAGLYPGAKLNAYNYTIINNPPITVVIDEMRSPYVYGYGYGVRSRVFGYFMRLDWAWGVDEGEISKMFYFSLSLDF